MNEQNLIPFNKRTPEEHKALSSKGGIRSGEARRRKREQIEATKIKDQAMREEREENARILAEASKMLLEAELENTRALHENIKYYLQLTEKEN